MKVDLKPQDKAALRWSAVCADTWYGSFTGDPIKEATHKKAMEKVNIALKKLGIRQIKARS